MTAGVIHSCTAADIPFTLKRLRKTPIATACKVIFFYSTLLQ